MTHLDILDKRDPALQQQLLGLVTDRLAHEQQLGPQSSDLLHQNLRAHSNQSGPLQDVGGLRGVPPAGNRRSGSGEPLASPSRTATLSSPGEEPMGDKACLDVPSLALDKLVQDGDVAVAPVKLDPSGEDQHSRPLDHPWRPQGNGERKTRVSL